MPRPPRHQWGALGLGPSQTRGCCRGQSEGRRHIQANCEATAPATPLKPQAQGPEVSNRIPGLAGTISFSKTSGKMPGGGGGSRYEWAHSDRRGPELPGPSRPLEKVPGVWSPPPGVRVEAPAATGAPSGQSGSRQVRPVMGTGRQPAASCGRGPVAAGGACHPEAPLSLSLPPAHLHHVPCPQGQTGLLEGFPLLPPTERCEESLHGASDNNDRNVRTMTETPSQPSQRSSHNMEPGRLHQQGKAGTSVPIFRMGKLRLRESHLPRVARCSWTNSGGDARTGHCGGEASCDCHPTEGAA